MRLVAISLLLALAGCGGNTPIPPPIVQSWTISNGSVTVGMSAAYGAAVVSVTDKHGTQYVDTADHGREFQTAYQLDNLGEGENPTEAGSAANGSSQTTSTVILNAAITSTNSFTSTVHPAFWNAYNGTLVSPDTLTKTVTVGYGGLDNVLRWDVTITIASNHSTSNLEGLTGYGPLFPTLLVQQVDGTFIQMASPPNTLVEPMGPMIEVSADGSAAVGAYSPGYRYFNEVNIANVGVDKWDTAWWQQTPMPAGTYSYTAYVIVGTLAEVEASLIALESAP